MTSRGGNFSFTAIGGSDFRGVGFTGCGKSRFEAGFGGTSTLACAGFAIVVESVVYAWPTKPHRQECLCYSTFSAACEARVIGGQARQFPKK